VATARSIQIPTILLDELDQRANFHRSECCRFLSVRQTSDRWKIRVVDSTHWVLLPWRRLLLKALQWSARRLAAVANRRAAYALRTRKVSSHESCPFVPAGP